VTCWLSRVLHFAGCGMFGVRGFVDGMRATEGKRGKFPVLDQPRLAASRRAHAGAASFIIVNAAAASRAGDIIAKEAVVCAGTPLLKRARDDSSHPHAGISKSRAQARLLRRFGAAIPAQAVDERPERAR
jgi:hypothetical protein